MDKSAEAVETEDKLTLDRPATYQIKVPGHLDESWIEWAGRMTVAAEWDDDDTPVTILTSAAAGTRRMNGP